MDAGGDKSRLPRDDDHLHSLGRATARMAACHYGPLDASDDFLSCLAATRGRSSARKNPVEEIRAIRGRRANAGARKERTAAEMQLSRIDQRLGIRGQELNPGPPHAPLRPGHARVNGSGGGRRVKRARKSVVPRSDVLDEGMRAPEEPAGDTISVVPARRARPSVGYACTCVAALAGTVIALDVMAGHPIEQVLQLMNVDTLEEKLWKPSPPPLPKHARAPIAGTGGVAARTDDVDVRTSKLEQKCNTKHSLGCFTSQQARKANERRPLGLVEMRGGVSFFSLSKELALPAKPVELNTDLVPWAWVSCDCDPASPCFSQSRCEALSTHGQVVSVPRKLLMPDLAGSRTMVRWMGTNEPFMVDAITAVLRAACTIPEQQQQRAFVIDSGMNEGSAQPCDSQI